MVVVAGKAITKEEPPRDGLATDAHGATTKNDANEIRYRYSLFADG